MNKRNYKESGITDYIGNATLRRVAYMLAAPGVKCTSTCWQCGEYGHIARNCDRVICYYCNGKHTVRACPYRILRILSRLDKAINRENMQPSRAIYEVKQQITQKSTEQLRKDITVEREGNYFERVQLRYKIACRNRTIEPQHQVSLDFYSSKTVNEQINAEILPNNCIELSCESVAQFQFESCSNATSNSESNNESYVSKIAGWYSFLSSVMRGTAGKEQAKGVSIKPIVTYDNDRAWQNRPFDWRCNRLWQRPTTDRSSQLNTDSTQSQALGVGTKVGIRNNSIRLATITDENQRISIKMPYLSYIAQSCVLIPEYDKQALLTAFDQFKLIVFIYQMDPSCSNNSLTNVKALHYIGYLFKYAVKLPSVAKDFYSLVDTIKNVLVEAPLLDELHGSFLGDVVDHFYKIVERRFLSLSKKVDKLLEKKVSLEEQVNELTYQVNDAEYEIQRKKNYIDKLEGKIVKQQEISQANDIALDRQKNLRKKLDKTNKSKANLLSFNCQKLKQVQDRFLDYKGVKTSVIQLAQDKQLKGRSKRTAINNVKLEYLKSGKCQLPDMHYDGTQDYYGKGSAYDQYNDDYLY